MKSHRTVYIIYFSLCTLIALYFFITGGGDRARAGTVASNTGSDGRGAPSGTGSSTSMHEGKSLFESDFFSGSAPRQPIEDPGKIKSGGDVEEPDILEPADKDNPKNPRTGRPFSNKMMRRFDALRKIFPNNSLIPRKKTAEEIKLEREYKRKMFGVYPLMVQGRAAPEQINQYFDYKTKPIKDRIELLSHITKKYRGKMSPEFAKKYEKVLNVSQKALDRIENRRKKALEKAGVYTE